MTKYLIAAVVGAILFVGGLFTAITLSPAQTAPSLGSSIDVPGFTKPTTATSSLLTTTSQDILSTSTGRSFASITNLSGAAIYCNANLGQPAKPYTGITIMASSTYVWSLDTDNLYRGTISCVTPASTASTTAYDK